MTKGTLKEVDSGIKKQVKILSESGIKTFESCEGGNGHAFFEPTILFEGGPEEGFRAYAIAVYNGFNVRSIKRCWRIDNNELTGPYWEIIFSNKVIGKKKMVVQQAKNQNLKSERDEKFRTMAAQRH